MSNVDDLFDLVLKMFYDVLVVKVEVIRRHTTGCPMKEVRLVCLLHSVPGMSSMSSMDQVGQAAIILHYAGIDSWHEET